MKKILLLIAVAGGLYLYSKRGKKTEEQATETDDSSSGGSSAAAPNTYGGDPVKEAQLATAGRGDGAIKPLTLVIPKSMVKQVVKNFKQRGITTPVRTGKVLPKSQQVSIRTRGQVLSGLPSVW